MPFQERALPEASTAMQKDEEAHDTELKLPVPSMFCAEDQEVPFQETTLPPQSTAIQKDDDVHDTEVSLR